MNTLGTPAVARILKSESHKLHHEFTVAKGEEVVVYDANFIALNSITFSVNGEAITPRVYATSHAATITALAADIEALTAVESARLDPTDPNNRTILVVPATTDVDPTITSVVTLGASQAVMSSSWKASTILPGTPVAINDNGEVRPYRGSAEAANYLGFSIKEAASGEYVTIACEGYAIISVEAGATVIPGGVNFSVVNTTTNYNEVTQTSGYTTAGWGVVFTDAVNGDVIEMLLR